MQEAARELKFRSTAQELQHRCSPVLWTTGELFTLS
jgi:hypothetical protein